MKKLYLVNIAKIKKFDMNVPVLFSSNSTLLQLYVRTSLFDSIDIDFGWEELKAVDKEQHTLTSTTQIGSEQPFDRNVSDTDYRDLGGYANLQIIPMHKNYCCVLVDDDCLQTYDGDLRAAIFDRLIDELEIDFVYTATTKA